MGFSFSMEDTSHDLLPLKPFYFIRHGETDWNKKTIVMGSQDIPLNSTGINQAQNAAHFLEGEEFKIIIASPKLRAKQTAEMIASHTKRVLLFDEGLVERLWGEAEGKPDDPTKSFYEDTDTPRGAESFSAFQKRVVGAVSSILMQHDFPLIVSHGGVFRAITHHLGITMSSANCSPFLFSPPGEPTHPWRVCPLREI